MFLPIEAMTKCFYVLAQYWCVHVCKYKVDTHPIFKGENLRQDHVLMTVNIFSIKRK